MADKLTLLSQLRSAAEASKEYTDLAISRSGGLTVAAKQAILQLAQKVAYVDDAGQDYYDALYNAFYPKSVTSITAVFQQSGVTIYENSNIEILRNFLTVTAFYDDNTSEEVTTYTLSGTLTAGTSTITATYAGKSATFNVIVTAARVLASISAVYTQSRTVYDTDTIDSLKADLVVTAVYADSSTDVVSSVDYTLSGTLTEGISTITVSYGGKTTTFSVTVTDHVIEGWLYRFNQSLLSSGTKDFGWSGTEGYSTGHDGTGYSYWNQHQTENTSEADHPGLVATGYTVPDLSGDFTISFWYKTNTNKDGQILSPFEVISQTGNLTSFTNNAENVASGWSVTKANAGKGIKGCRIWFTSSKLQIRLVNSSFTHGASYNVEFPSSVSTTVWHHYAFVRKDGVFSFYFDGQRIFTLSNTYAFLWANQVAFADYFDTAESTNLGPLWYTGYYDDLFVAEYAKWDSEFDPAAITY